RTIGRNEAQSRQLTRFHSDQAYRISPKMRIPYDSSFSCAHAGPTFQWSMILVHSRHHHAANIERFLAARIGFIIEDVADAIEAIAGMRILLHVAVDCVASGCSARKALAGHHVGVIVVAEQDVTGFVDVMRPVLCLTIDSHDAAVSADALV